MRYKILKLSGAPTFNLRLKRNVVPHKFNCQTDRAVAHGSKPRTAIQKRDHLAILKTIPVESEINQPTPDVFENVLTTPDTPGHLLNPDPSDGVMVVDVEEVELLGTADKACQVQILKPQPPKPHVRSKAIQTDIISKTKPKKAVVPPSLTDYLSPEKNMVAQSFSK
ncbi:uncharacterized protein LOC103521494 [Diaphorina citri]|uniref:Uncharacterized protein LOC103521494 n=1 Tax=Diaphorina citri TaxID=121845 RepID=A0A3Q0JM84_DIACI|nr:uncharacterized protein LOC103521494 [Diaphorina citri]